MRLCADWAAKRKCERARHPHWISDWRQIDELNSIGIGVSYASRHRDGYCSFPNPTWPHERNKSPRVQLRRDRMNEVVSPNDPHRKQR
jgi:hypothetical protein